MVNGLFHSDSRGDEFKTRCHNATVVIVRKRIAMRACGVDLRLSTHIERIEEDVVLEKWAKSRKFGETRKEGWKTMDGGMMCAIQWIVCVVSRMDEHMCGWVATDDVDF